MAEGVERFRLHPLRNSGYQLVPDPKGEYGRYSDYLELLGLLRKREAELGEEEERKEEAEAQRDQARQEVLEEVREYAEKRRDDCNEGALRLNPSTQLGREHSAEAHAFGSVVNFLATLDPSGEMSEADLSDEDHSAHEILKEAGGLDPSGEEVQGDGE